jgi:hypothetical protein
MNMPQKTFQLSISDIPEKKYMVKYFNEKTKEINTIHFGTSAYENYIQHNDEDRKRLYKIRHGKDKINDIYSAGCWSWWLLWNKKTLKESIENMEERFRIDIIIS